MFYLENPIKDCELKTIIQNPLKSKLDELEIMTRPRDFDIDTEWRKQPWMKNYPTKTKIQQ